MENLQERRVCEFFLQQQIEIWHETTALIPEGNDCTSISPTQCVRRDCIVYNHLLGIGSKNQNNYSKYQLTAIVSVLQEPEY
jgi:hypothetical protein